MQFYPITFLVIPEKKRQKRIKAQSPALPENHLENVQKYKNTPPRVEWCAKFSRKLQRYFIMHVLR